MQSASGHDSSTLDLKQDLRQHRANRLVRRTMKAYKEREQHLLPVARARGDAISRGITRGGMIPTAALSTIL